MHKQNIQSDHVNGRADSGGHGPPEESLHGSIGKTNKDREPDYNWSTGIMPSSHPHTSESDCSLSDDFPTQPCTTRTWSSDPDGGSNRGRANANPSPLDIYRGQWVITLVLLMITPSSSSPIEPPLGTFYVYSQAFSIVPAT